MPKALWDRYAKIWSANEATRKSELSACLAPNVTYRDPQVEVTGYDNFSNYMAEFQTGFPGCSFKIKNVIEHHDRELANWELQNKDGDILMTGTSFAVRTADNQFQELNGFFEVPSQ